MTDDEMERRQTVLENLRFTAELINDELLKAEKRLPALQTQVELLLRTAEDAQSALSRAAETAADISV